MKKNCSCGCVPPYPSIYDIDRNNLLRQTTYPILLMLISGNMDDSSDRFISFPHGQAQIEVRPKSGYFLPDDIIVDGANYTYQIDGIDTDHESGIITILNPTGPVLVSVNCVGDVPAYLTKNYIEAGDDRTITITGYSVAPELLPSNLVINSRYKHDGQKYTVISVDSSSINRGAFQDASSLTSVVIPSTVTSIGDGTFNGCSSLESIAIPFVGGSKDVASASSSTLFGYIFGQIEYDDSVDVEQHYGPGSSDYIVYYIPSTLRSVTVTGGNTSGGEHILLGAFMNCGMLTSIVFGDNISSIDEGVLSGCSGLTSITIPLVGGSGSATEADATTLFGYIFGSTEYDDSTPVDQRYGSGSSEHVTYYIPDSLRSVTVTGGNILYGEFCRCSGLTSVTIPDSVTSIGAFAFYNCSGLTSLTIPDSVTSIGDHVFHGCSGLTSIIIPDSVISIGEAAFYGCTGVVSITIPDRVTTIGDHAFHGCSGLTSVIIGDSVASIGTYVFSHCSGLTSVIIGDSMTSIGDYMFSYCSGLTSITIPAGVTTIGQHAFYGCSGLTSVSFAEGSQLTSIGYRAFSGCSGLTSITYNSTIADWNSIDKGAGWDYGMPPYVIHCTDGDIYSS